MATFITGGCKNGKSSLALSLAVSMAGSGAKNRRFYVATMLPEGAEDRERIVYHRRARAGMGFETIEAGRLWEVQVLPDMRDAVFVVDSVTALVQNAMFPPMSDNASFSSKNGNLREKGYCPDAADSVIADIERFLFLTRNVIFISDYIYSNAKIGADFGVGFGVEFGADSGADSGANVGLNSDTDMTDAYMRALAAVDSWLARHCDRVLEVCAAAVSEHKAANQAETGGIKTEDIRGDKEATGMELVIGGAYQGKLAYVMEKYALSEADICRCDVDSRPDFSRRCVYQLERYLLGCLRRGEEPELDFAADSVVVMTDIFCGLVPMSVEERAWRELCGKTLAKISSRADRVTRVFCGLPQQLK